MAITTTTKITSHENAYTAYFVTAEQVSKCTPIQEGQNGPWLMIVESQTEAGKEYRVRYNREFKKLTCTCPAGQEGIGCWHKRAALAFIAIERLAARAEAAAVEADPAVQEEQAEVSAAQEAEVASRYHDSTFCGDSNCPCHDNNGNYHEYIIHPLYEGLLTVDEANRIYYGLQ